MQPVLLWLGLVLSAWAQPRAARDPLPALEVERPLVLPRGQVQLGLSYERHVGHGRWTSQGERQPLDGVRLVARSERVSLAYGVSNRAEVWWELPFVQARLTPGGWEGAVVSAHGLGDPRFGWRWSLLREEAPSASAMVEAWYEAPAARAPTGVVGPLRVSALAFTTGTPDLYMGGGYKRKVGPLAFSARGGWLLRLPGAVRYGVEVGGDTVHGRIDPGDELELRLEALLQAGPFFVSAEPLWELRFATHVGGRHLEPVMGSDGEALDVRLGGGVNLTRALDLAAWVVLPVTGEDLMFFPLRDLHPTLGPTWGVAVEGRP